jgi:hypothetical protein
MLNQNIVVILGHSGAGKDYLAKKLWPSYTTLKLNQPFKDLFEVHHGLVPGDCNDRTKRAVVLKEGPLAGRTIQDGMVIAYHQSLEPQVPSYGTQFAGLTILRSLEQLFYHRGQYVITDLRKPSEASMLRAFAEILGYTLEVFQIETTRGKAMSSDSQILEIAQLLNRPITKLHN